MKRAFEIGMQARRPLCLAPAAFLCVILSFSSSWAAALRAGTAKVKITPDIKANNVYIAGFGNDRVATGVHDDLYVRCLALGAGSERVAMCSADLIGLFYDDVLKVRARVKAQAPETTHVIVASTHNHEGPDTLGLWGPSPSVSGIDKKYLDRLDDQIAACAVQALRSMVEARMTLARDDHPLLALLQDDSRPPFVKDPYLFVMRLDALSTGKPIATLINWSDHPETLGGKNTEITADYPYWLCQYVEQQVGGTAIFFSGSIGGLLSTLGPQVSLEDPETGEIAQDGTWRKAELFGNTTGKLAVRALRAGENFEVDSLLVRSKVVFAPLTNDRFRIAAAAGIFKNRKPLFTDGQIDPTVAEKEFPDMGKLKYATGKEIQTEVDYLSLLSWGRRIAEFATIPGEIYPELINGGIVRYPGADFPEAPFEPALRPHLKSQYQFILGLANDELGYIIPKAEWDNQPPWLGNKKERWYGEVNSAGPEIAGAVMNALISLIEQ